MRIIIFILKLIGIQMSNARILEPNHKLVRMNKPLNILILLLLASVPTTFFYKYFTTEDKSLLSTAVMMLIPFTNYMVILNYFKKPYFFKVYTDIVYNKDYTTYSLEKIILSNTIGITAFTLIISYVYYFMGYRTISLDMYVNKLYLKIILFIYSVVYNFYSRFIFLLNANIFFIVFYKHYIDICNEENKIKDKKSWTVDKYKTSISVICYNLLFIRTEIRQSIKLLEYIYITSTVLGSISIGIIIQNKEINIFLVGSIIIWGIMQIVFLFIMSLITEKKGDLINQINKPKFSIHYLIKDRVIDNSEDIIKNIENDRRKEYYVNNISISGNTVSVNSDNKSKYIGRTIIDNSASIDWIILHKILEDKWASFQFMGITFENTDGIKKIIGMVGLIIYASHIISNDLSFSLK
jgi:hypothetical protein